jgi:hypothetical protein
MSSHLQFAEQWRRFAAAAEREGFEPSMDETAHTGFRDRRLSERNTIICRLLTIRVLSVGKLVGKSVPVTR